MDFFEIPNFLETQCFIEKNMTFLDILIQLNLRAHSKLITLAQCCAFFISSVLWLKSAFRVFLLIKISPQFRFLEIPDSKEIACLENGKISRFLGVPILSKTVYTMSV